MDILAVAVISLLGIAAAATIGARLGIASPLLLTAAGIVVGLLPFVPLVVIEPEWILAGVLPPLLYSAAVSLPTMEFRRDFSAISGLSIVLVVISATLLGLLFDWLIPGIGFAGGVALGAIISPTDAVAISIVKKLGVSPRAVVVLEGESLLNDATALVVLRAAIAGIAAAVSLWGALGDFFYSVAVAVAFGVGIGWLNLRVRARIKDSTVNTVISFTIPFVAAIPAEHLGASGLVAAVVAGLVTGRGGPRWLSPQHRLSDAQNWRAIEVILEGAIFLVMGLELTKVVADVQQDQAGLASAIGIAALALLGTILIRAAYVAPLLAALNVESRRGAAMKQRVAAMQQRLSAPAQDGAANTAFMVGQTEAGGRNAALRQRRMELSPQKLEQFRTRVQTKLADIDYMLAEPLGWREGGVVVWAGMRGAVTLAAAQTLPEDTPSRSLLIFIAFMVAVGSLLLQGGTLSWLIRVLKPAGQDPEAVAAERGQLRSMLDHAALDALDREGMSAEAQRMREILEGDKEDLASRMDSVKRVRLKVIAAQRQALLAAQDNGEYSAAALGAELKTLDADQISLELRGKPESE